MKRIFLVTIMILLILGLTGCKDNKEISNDKKNEETIITIVNNEGKTEKLTLKELSEVYSNNQAKFEKLYLGAKATYEGVIEKIQTGSSINLGGCYANAPSNISIHFEENNDVKVFFGLKESDYDVTTLNKGDKVKVSSIISNFRDDKYGKFLTIANWDGKITSCKWGTNKSTIEIII